jgi:hypothetical protein
MTSTPEVAAIAVDQQTQAISRFEALSHEIEIAMQESLEKRFNYESKDGNKLARSWVSRLRRIKGSIERARKDAKAVHIERGKNVDAAAKSLELAVQELIDPHEREIKAIEGREQARIDAHRAVLDRILQLTEGIATSSEAQERLLELSAIDVSKLEEFAQAGANRQAEAGEKLRAIWEELVIRESEQAELEALRKEKAEREEAEKNERIQLEVAADAIAVAEAAEKRAKEAEQRAAEAEALISKKEAETAIAEIEALSNRDALISAIAEAMAGMNRLKIAEAIIDGKLHPAVSIDWSKAV